MRNFSGFPYCALYFGAKNCTLRTHYLLTPVGYFPIIVRKFLKRFLGYRTLFGVRYGLLGKGKSKLNVHSADILRHIALKVSKNTIAKRYSHSAGNLHDFLNK